MSMDAQTQLELFDLPAQRIPRSATHGMGAVTVRYDHAVLFLIAVLIGISAVFAWGVERGKRLAQSEHPWLPETTTAAGPSAKPDDSASTSSRAESSTAASNAKQEAEASSKAPTPTAPSPAKKLKAPIRVASASSGFAIQLVSYSQPSLARQELSRLKQRGEQVLVLTKQGKTLLLIGPFPTKRHASEKLTSLKKRYQDCFIRSL